MIDSQLNSITGQLSRRDISILELPQCDIPAPKYRDLHQLEQLVEGLNTELNTLERNMDSIRVSYIRTLENYNVLKKMNELWAAIDVSELIGEPSNASNEQMQVSSLTGLISAEKMMPLERMLW